MQRVKGLTDRWSGAALIAVALFGMPALSMAVTPTVDQVAARVSVSRPATSTGQTATLLSDGRWLILGGTASSHVQATAQFVDLRGGKSRTARIAAVLAHARSGHTATVLPDGSVLILGGVDDSGAPVTIAERFHPDTARFETLGNLGTLARSQHTATLLMDGTVLVAGGVDARGRALDQVELLDAATLGIQSFNARLDEARYAQLAALLPSGGVFVWGGLGNDRQPLASGEVFDHDSGRFALLGEAGALVPQQDYRDVVPAVAATWPAADAADVPIGARIAIRFDKPLSPETLTGKSVSLIGPSGPVDVQVVAAEGGLLAFATPTQQLLPASHYTLFVNGGQDESARTVAFTAIAFTTEQIGGTGKGARPATTTPAAAVAKPAATTASAPLPAASAVAISVDDEEWVPGPQNFHGDWRSQRRGVAKLSMPHRQSVLHALYGTKVLATAAPLAEAGPGVTAVAGQVLRLNGKPLPGATLSVAGQSVTTDSNGEFLLANIPSGAQTLVIDGSTANQDNRQYGRYEYLLNTEAGKTLALPFVIWMSKLDIKDEITIASPTTGPTVLTNPHIPGLELRLPAGMVIRDAAGKVVTRLDMTAIPTDQAPFPLPNVPVPTYFTIQPGGAHLLGLTPEAAKGAQLVYPNFTQSKPGTRLDFWNYDPRGKGWYVYGQGTVTPDGTQVVPDPGVAIYELTGAMLAVPGTAPPSGPPPCGCSGGDPVDLFTGLFVHENTDLAIADVIPLEVRRVYRNEDHASRAFGIGTNLGYDMFLVGDAARYSYADLILPDGGRVHFVATSPGSGYAGAVFVAQTPMDAFAGAVLTWGDPKAPLGVGWTMRLKDGTYLTFPDVPSVTYARLAAVNSIIDRYGNALTFTRDANANLTQITSPNGRTLQFTYDASNRITDVTDDIGRNAHYDYDSLGRLITATDVAGAKEQYTYDDADRMLTVTDPRGNRMVLNEYDSEGRVWRQTYADNATNKFAYAKDVNGRVVQTDVTDGASVVTRIAFDAAGLPLTITHALGRPEQETVNYTRDPVNEWVTSTSDQHGRTTTTQYDTVGNPKLITKLQGTPSAVSWNYSYDPTYNELLTAADPMSHGLTVTPDNVGNPHMVTDTLGHATTREFDSAGRLQSETRNTGARSFTTSANYAGADLASVIDQLSRVVNFRTDSVGRLRQVTAPLGLSESRTPDAFDRPILSLNTLNQSTASRYDENGNLTDFTDSNGNTTHFDYDTRNRLVAKTDPLKRVESYSYDATGRVASKVDRKGQLTGFSYDGLGRITQIGYGATVAAPTTFKSTISYAYAWAGSSLTLTVTDSIAGVTTHVLDEFNRLKRVVSPQGQIDYTYYPNGLRETMTVAGQPTITYGWDGANRLQSIQQAAGPVNNNAAQTIVIGHDDADRRSSVTLANGIQMVYDLDDAGQLRGITYKNADGSQYGTLTYGYDDAGHRVAQGGTLAALDTASSTVSGETYDADNKLASAWAGVTYAYDLNGNVTGDGTRLYNWNERNQLASITQGAATIASFQYDAFGQRVAKTISGTTTGYLYDHGNPVQEMTAATSNTDHSNFKANIINGAGLDERYLRIAGSGSTATLASFLVDGLGSTIALALPNGAIQAKYSYQAYGATTQITPSGQAISDNPYQYTGRENDGVAGLYYYRARYYNPTIGRFMHEDPIGLAGGQNIFAYAQGRPTEYSDPTGNCIPLCLIILEPIAAALGIEVGTLVGGSLIVAETAGAVATGAVTPVGGAAEYLEAQAAKGGVYLLRDLETGLVMRTGRTCDLARREGEHARDLVLGDYGFEAVAKTDVYAEQRGLEQLLHEQYAPPLNYVNPISAANKSFDYYVISGLEFLGY